MSGEESLLERLRGAEARERILQEQNDAFDTIGAQMSERIRVLEAENDRFREREAALLKFVDRISEIVKFPRAR